jgi:hypothetical protein
LHWFYPRVIYYTSIYILSKFGINMFFASYFISTISVSAGLILLLIIAKKLMDEEYIYSLPPLAIIFGAIVMSKYSSPDGIAFFAQMLSVYLFLNKKYFMLFLVLIFIVAIRTDMIVFSIPFLLYLWFTTNKKMTVGLVFVFTMLFYFYLNYYFQHPGWEKVFSYTFINEFPRPMSQDIHITFLDYLKQFIKAGDLGLYNGAAMITAIMTGYYLSIVIIGVRRNGISYIKDTTLGIGIIAVSYSILHFIAFPVFWERFFLGSSLLLSVSLLAFISKSRKSILYIENHMA